MNQIQHFIKQLHLKEWKSKKFPKNHRFITERLKKILVKVSDELQKHRDLALPKRPFWVGLLLGLALLLLGILVFQLSITTERWFALQHKRSQLQADMKLWEGIIQKYPTYRDAYFEAALIAYQLNDREKAWVFVEKVMQLDPNFAQGKELENKLEKGK